jgi:hypothetical protein
VRRFFVDGWTELASRSLVLYQHRPEPRGKSALGEQAYAALTDPTSPHRVACFDEHGPLQPIPHRGRQLAATLPTAPPALDVSPPSGHAPTAGTAASL